jgi:hypothetical protein
MPNLPVGNKGLGCETCGVHAMSRGELEAKIDLDVREALQQAEESLVHKYPTLFDSAPTSDTMVGVSTHALIKAREEYIDMLKASVRYTYWMQLPDEKFAK